jgi:transketolase
MLDRVTQACSGLDVTILYYTTLTPFDSKTLESNCETGKVVICEPYYSGALAYDVQRTFTGRGINILSIGVPRQFLRKYGSAEEHDKHLGLDVEGIEDKITKFIKD